MAGTRRATRRMPHPLRRCWTNTCVGGCYGGGVIALFSTVGGTDVSGSPPATSSGPSGHTCGSACQPVPP